MAKKIQTAELNKKRLGDLLADEYRRWEQIYRHGCQDPFWSDGSNLNLVRNHIIWYRGRIETELQPEDYPDEYSRELPPEVPQNYMADVEGIMRDAAKTLEAAQKSADYAYLMNLPIKYKMDAEIEKMRFPVNYVSRLRGAIQENDLITMRRYRDPEKLLEVLRDRAVKIAEKLKEPKPEPTGQLSIFDFMQG